jgi:pilus assembly protein Flp/PilA
MTIMRKLLFRCLVSLHSLRTDENGQDLVEYALVVALVAFGATAALQQLGLGLNTAFSTISSTLSSSLN